MNNKSHTSNLGTPNDDSIGHCYAPVENGIVNRHKKRHIPEGKSCPPGWEIVDCDPDCQLKDTLGR